jgi:lipid-binding SYLF domain-containing protein
MNEKSIADRMYLKTAKSLAVFNGEVHPALVAQLPQGLLEAGTEQADVVLLFAMNQNDLDKFFAAALERLGEKGSLWIAFLKPTAAKATDLTRDTVSDWVKERGVVAVANMSIDGDWSSLRVKRID